MKTAKWIAISCLFLVLVLPAPVGAVNPIFGVPKFLSVQGVLRNADFYLVEDRDVGYELYFQMYEDGDQATPAFWAITKTVYPKSGVFSVDLTFDYTSVVTDWPSKSGAYLGMSVCDDGRACDLDNTSRREIMRKPVISVPYTVNAQLAQTATSALRGVQGTALSDGVAAKNLICTNCVHGGASGDLATKSDPGIGVSTFAITASNMAVGSVTTTEFLSTSPQSGTILFDDLVNSGCVNKSIIKSNGVTFGCFSDQTSGGTLVRLASGPGITLKNPSLTVIPELNAAQPEGTVSISAGAITNSMLLNSSITINAGDGLSGGGAISLGASALTIGIAAKIGVGLGGLGRDTGCPVGSILTWDTGEWRCLPSKVGTLRSLSATDPLILTPSPLTSGAGVLSLGTIGPFDGGTGVSVWDPGYIYRGDVDSPMLKSQVYSDDYGVGINTTFTTDAGGQARALTVSGSEGLNLLLGAAAANLVMKGTGDTVSIGSSTSVGGIQFYNTQVVGTHTSATDGGVKFYPAEGRVFAHTFQGNLRAKFESVPFTTPTTCGASPFIAVAFSDDVVFSGTGTSGWAEGPMDLEINRTASMAGSSGSLQSRFICHDGLVPSSGSDFCRAEIHDSKTVSPGTIQDGFIAGYYHDSSAKRLIVYLRGGVAYTYRSNQLVVKQDVGACLAAVNLRPWDSTASLWGVVAPNGIRMEGALTVAPGASDVLFTGTKSEAVVTPAGTDNKYMVEVNAVPLSALGGIKASYPWYAASPGSTLADPYLTGSYYGARKVTTTAATTGVGGDSQSYKDKKATIDSNPDNTAGGGFTVGAAGGFFTYSNASADPYLLVSRASMTNDNPSGNYVAFTGAQGLDMNGYPLKRGCPRGWTQYAGGGVCMAPYTGLASYSVAAQSCGLVEGAHMCGPDEIRAAIATTTADPALGTWYGLFQDVWLNDQSTSGAGAVAMAVVGVQPRATPATSLRTVGGTYGNPEMRTADATVTNVQRFRCCYSL